MTQAQFTMFEKALVAAKNAMMKFAEVEDGGSCNFDTPVRRIKASEKMMSQSDFRIVKVDEKGWKDCWFIFLPLMGQANRRTMMAEEAVRVLQLNGFDAMMYYQLD